MVSIILISALIIIILVILLSFILRINERPKRLKAKSIVIIDTRGQQAVSENEFVRFMDKMNAILSNGNPTDLSDDLSFSKAEAKNKERKRFQSKYIDPAAEELKQWIRSTDNYPYVMPAKFTNPIDDELHDMAGESNPIMLGKKHEKVNKDLSTMQELAEYVKQIKEINLQYPDNERRPVNMVQTHKLVVEILKHYYDALDPTIFERPLPNMVDLTSSKNKPVGEAKMKAHKKQLEPILDSSLSQRNSLVDVSGFADDDKIGTSNSRNHDKLDTDKADQAIENMAVRKAGFHTNFRGGRKFIKIEN